MTAASATPIVTMFQSEGASEKLSYDFVILQGSGCTGLHAGWSGSGIAGFVE